KVAKHQRYLAGEEGSDPDSHAPKPAKATKKSKPSAPKAAPVKKHKLIAETYDEPSPAKSSKPGKVTKRRKPTSSLSLVDEFVDEGIPEKEPMFDDEEADMQREGKGKEKVSDEQVALDLLTLQAPKKSPSIYAKLGLTDSDTEFDEEVPTVVKVRAQDKGQAEPNPGVQTEGQARPNPGDDADPQPQSSPVVHAGPNLEHMDLETTDVLTQQNPEQMDEGFTATAYPNIQENLKLTVDEQVLFEEPASFTRTLSSLQHFAKDFSFGDQFFNDKPSKAENEKTTVETEAESMSPVIIIRTDNGTKFKNQVLKEYFDNVGISHQMSSVRTPQQNGVVERRNRTLVEAARTMHTQDEAATLREIVESERLLSLLNTSLAYACKYTRRIQELLMILQQTCPSITDLGTKLVAVTPKNKTKQIRHTVQITKSKRTTVATSPSTNIDSNTPVISSTGVTLVSSASGSKSQDNTKKNRIRRRQKKAKKTELEDHLRTVKSSLNKASVVDSKATSSVIKSVLNVNSNLKCASGNGCLFSDNQDACVVAYINSMNTSKKSKSVKTPVKRKHMTGDRSQLINFVQKFLVTVKFGNDHVAKIMGYGDY
nr:retrotransposon protein, putative, Ty1-copia subclass [Tanacetum cinerariifolium]